VIVGRDRERARLRAAVDAARAGEGAALVLVGEPGAGKSVLLADAVEAGPDLRVLRGGGVESEYPLAYAALHRLLRPVLRHVDALPARQAGALLAALGMADTPDGAPADRFVVYLATLTLLSEAASERPLLLVVDDAHWLDDASRDAVLFVARRVEGERIAVLLAAREEAVVGGLGLPEVRVDTLDQLATGALLSGVTGTEVPHAVAAVLHERTGGNALALAELARTLDRQVLVGRSPVPGELPLTGGVESAFLGRYRALEPAARTVVLVAAADDSGDAATVLTAARALGVDDDALEAAERSGLLTTHDGRLELRHPLVRSAVYAGATTPERRRAHAALAEALTGPDAADRRAWHRAAAADRPDESVVAELEAAARRSADVGGHEAASAAWERAAELTADPGARARRLYSAASAAWTAARPARAGSLADAALAAVTDPLLRADVALLRARVEWNTGSVPVAHRRLLQEATAVAAEDPDRGREMAMFAASLAVVTHLPDAGDTLDLVGAPSTPRQCCVADVLRAFVHIAGQEWGPAVAAVRSAVAHAQHAELGVDDLLPTLGMAALHVALDDVALHLHERLLAEARGAGAHIMVLYALTRRGAADAVLGRWDELGAGARESLTLAAATGRTALEAMPRAWLALVAAMRGDDDAPERLGDLQSVVDAGPLGSTGASVRDQVLWTRALLAETPADALHHYEQMTHGFAERMIALDRIETAVHAGRRDLAERWVGQIADFGEGSGSAWARAVAEHGRALLAEGADVGGHLVRALELHQDAGRRVDAARTALAYGEWLRRERRRVDAREHLRAALQTFEDVGARRWADRAAQELRASGERARRRDPGAAGSADLTPTELEVARLVARGLPTREVAAQLFVSPRTIDFHLRNVFTKLGVTSRAELAHVPLG
jgi:DNA-binding CsgD family transcriptional regulator